MIEFQRKLLGDAVRNDALSRALKAVITPGCTVTDIGSGTGFLSFLALGLGAKHCYLYETSHDLLRLSQCIARANGLHRRCTFVHAHSRDIRSPMKTDIVISETLGNFAYEEHIIETMNDAKRFLKPGGMLIPQKLRQFVAPVVTDRLWREINIWDDISRCVMVSGDEPSHRLNFDAAKEVALNNMYVKTVRRGDLLPPLPNPCLPAGRLPPEEGKWDSIDFTRKNTSKREGRMTWSFPRNITIYGFAVWWECDLVPGVTLSTSPFVKPTHWEQIFLPLLSPIEAKKGDQLSFHITANSSYKTGLNVTWHTTLHRGKKSIARQKQELQQGMIFP
ncbi:methyltransferase domain-containing protein [Candidatus Peregrinibacteria bacterium]|nr:methyltransferase domain-containing protein [Candidatus Peregrinibacteria bacterium]